MTDDEKVAEAAQKRIEALIMAVQEACVEGALSPAHGAMDLLIAASAIIQRHNKPGAVPGLVGFSPEMLGHADCAARAWFECGQGQGMQH